MKTFFKLQFAVLLASLFAVSCKKDEARVIYDSGTPPVLTATASGVDFTNANAAQTAVTLNWTNPAYTFNTGVSSANVAYNVQIDTLGSNFTNPAKKVIVVSKDLSYSINIQDLNDIMLNTLNLKDSVAHTLEMRVVSTLGNATTNLNSNSVQFTASPYQIPPKITPPASGTLYITGSATTKGWMSGGDAPVENQQFTQMNPTLFEITVPLLGGSYTFVPVYGDWGNKYSIKVKNDPGEVYGGDFQVGGDDILSPPAGTYKITVDFQKGKFTVVKQ